LERALYVLLTGWCSPPEPRSRGCNVLPVTELIDSVVVASLTEAGLIHSFVAVKADWASYTGEILLILFTLDAFTSLGFEDNSSEIIVPIQL